MRTACPTLWKNCGNGGHYRGGSCIRLHAQSSPRSGLLEIESCAAAVLAPRCRVARAVEEHYESDVESVSGWLAVHYEAAGMTEQAIRAYSAAASVAKRRFADAEAASLIQRALVLCREFSETPKRDAQELELLAKLGPALIATQGYSALEAGETYERGLLLSERCGDRTYLFSLLSGAWGFNTVRGRLEESRRLGQQCVDSPYSGSGGERIPGTGDGRPFSLGQ